MHLRLVILAAALLAAAAALLSPPPPALADGLPDLGDVAQNQLTPLMEKRIGERTMRDIRLNEPSYLDDPEVTSYVNRIGHRLVAQTEDPGQQFEFFVLRDATLNAFAMPGGYIGVHSGLIETTQSESELASVLGHEISHVTQHHMARQLAEESKAQVPALLAMVAALLAGRHNSDVTTGGIAAAQSAMIQTQLSYSRDFEREADRHGLDLLDKAGFDIRAMATFFERLQKYGRLYENNAPAYLLTHPLTTERISDMENRIQQRPYKQVPDSLDFWLVRAKLKATDSSPHDAVATFRGQVAGRKFANEIATHYGLGIALVRSGDYAAAASEVAQLRRLKAQSAMIENLAADVALKQDNPAEAVRILHAALLRYPHEQALSYEMVDAQLAQGRPGDALRTAIDELELYRDDTHMYQLQAQVFGALGQKSEEHRSQAEVYAYQGRTGAAIEQLELAQKAGDGDFYERSRVDARMRELKAQEAAEAKEKKEEQQ